LCEPLTDQPPIPFGAISAPVVGVPSPDLIVAEKPEVVRPDRRP
jgi:hypothetical protein